MVVINIAVITNDMRQSTGEEGAKNKEDIATTGGEARLGWALVLENLMPLTMGCGVDLMARQLIRYASLRRKELIHIK